MQGNIIWEIPKTGSAPVNAMLRLHTSLNVDGALDICQWSMNTRQDTLFIIQDRELSPLLTMKLGETTEPNALTIGDGVSFRTMPWSISIKRRWSRAETPVQA